ncbi:Carbonic anhydrase 2 [Harpegnathos saltator]|uniref:Carbonic anhydrase 2 n=1 Tax=Harpegnathos saltator TaxID=610380 RepID=E2BX04_HARSA|nr:Carbonic anhydrase 2 [Harpegnathos saltator]
MRKISTSKSGNSYTGLCLSQNFGYEGNDDPSHWGEKFETCVGKRQSPINIEDSNVKNVTLPPLKLYYAKKHCRATTIVNNGHTVMLQSNCHPVKVNGGPLGNDMYVFEQLHFHWGKNDNEGSETLINNQSSAMECHAVFRKEDYKSMNEALNYQDGLAVVGFMYDVKQRADPMIESIVTALPGVQEPDKKKQLYKPFSVVDLLAQGISSQCYYTYNGSLTTPPCLEVVRWIVLKHPRYLSPAQLAAFRQVHTHEGTEMTHNFRPTQPLWDREVFENIPNEQHSGQRNNKSPLPLMVLETLLGFLLSYSV